MVTFTVSDDCDLDILSSFQDLISGMSSDTKELLRKRFVDIAAQPCPPSEEQLLADEIVGKSYTLDESQEIKLSNLFSSFAMRNGRW